jgi:hypothetical protein
MEAVSPSLFYCCPEEEQGCNKKYKTLERLQKHFINDHSKQLPFISQPKIIAKRGRGGNNR